MLKPSPSTAAKTPFGRTGFTRRPRSTRKCKALRTLPSALLAAQRSPSGAPHVKVQILDRIGGVRRLRWERLYTGAEPDNHHALTMPGDGSLIALGWHQASCISSE